VASACQNDGGSFSQLGQQVPLRKHTAQDQRGSAQHEEDEAWEDEDLEDKATAEEELAQV
jgi:hypothetical protein